MEPDFSAAFNLEVEIFTEVEHNEDTCNYSNNSQRCIPRADE